MYRFLKNKLLPALALAIFSTYCGANLNAQSKEIEPYKAEYLNYVPDFIAKTKDWREFQYTEKEMERSSETKYYTLNEVEEVNRANALVKVAIESEASGDYRKAMNMYQDIITRFSIASDNNEVLYRVSPYGVFVPVAQYCQRRLLNFPKEHLDFFRTLRDPEAKELFDEAVKKYSLDLFSEIVDKYLATSYGGKSLLFLGDAALDRGNYLEALEHFKTIVDFIPDKNLQTPELSLKIQFCNKALGHTVSSELGSSKSNVTEKELQLLKAAIQQETPVQAKVHTQRTSSDYISSDDFTRFTPTLDPLGIVPPEWESDMLASRNDYFVYTQPVVTDTSVVFRHKNIIYCYSIINGNLRWKNDMGGRAVWQDWNARQYPQEDIVIQDGVVVTPLIKGGSSIVALDEITGQIKWSYGPMSSSDGDQSMMRFECAPAAGPGTIYANYVLDNIKGDTHIDSDYGVIAFESTTGRVKWRRQVCRLQPGKFDGSFGSARRNRIRSFFTPPLYHEGTIYVNSNAGAVAAMDSLSGRIKWLMRYPYHKSVHDLTRQFGELGAIHGGVLLVNPHNPSFWLNQRPLVVGEQVFILPVNSPFMMCLDRKTGKLNWSFTKPTIGFSYLLGPLSTGEMVLTANGRSAKKDDNGRGNFPVYLLDPKTGKETWNAPDYIMKDTQPVMTTYAYNTPAWFSVNGRYFETGARPFLSEDDKLIMTGWTDNSVWWRPGMNTYALGEIDLKNKKILGQRRFYSGATLAHADMIINEKTTENGLFVFTENIKKIPRRTPEQEAQIVAFEKVMKDTVPVNEYPAFMPFSRVTFTRYGIPFELRISPRKISMVYKRSDFEAKTANDNSLLSSFGKSELSVKDGDYKKASEYLNQCLTLVSPEDVNFRALIKQQFYKVYLELTRSAIRANKPKLQMENSLGMSNTASVLAEEVETLFALAESYAKNNNPKNASACLRTLIEVYGHHEFPISSLAAKASFFQEDLPVLNETVSSIFAEAKSNTGLVYKNEASKALDLTDKSFPLYLSSVSPLPKELVVRTGDLAILKLIELLKNSAGYEAEYSKIGDTELTGDKTDQLLYHIWKYPGTVKGQDTFNRICTISAALPDEDKREVWRKLSHVAKICKFKMPADLTTFLTVVEHNTYKDINPSNGDKTYEVANFKDGIMITLEREGDLSSHPNLLFVGVKIPKKVGFRFSLVCFDLDLGKEVWRKEEFRLKDLGKEPGFYKAYVYQDIVVINGMYDVFGFSLKDGAEIWHYKTPYSFEIYEATMSGNIFAISGNTETIALQIDTKSPVGEVAWQQKEEGTIYYKPYFVGDLLISVRKYPFNITSRYRTTGSLLARLAVPDLSQSDEHPMIKDGEHSLPISRYDRYVVVSDDKYLIVYDVVKMEMLWKTPIANVDLSKNLRMRVAVNEKYITLIKEDYDRKAIYCYDLLTGDIRWNTDPTNSGSLQAIYSMVLEGDILYGIGMHPGQGFYFVSYDCAKGTKKVNKIIEGFSSVPIVRLREDVYGKNLAVEVQDRKDFQIIVLDKNTGEIVKKVSDKGDGPIGEIGRVAITIQDGYPVLFSKIQFKY
jgi:outer membrane protein assembly factor BamB/tetratricopeptide (TPR) repeat protein